MKRKLIIAGVFVVLAWAGSSCEALRSCKTCKQVTYIDGVFDHEGTPSDYCDADLIKIEATPDFVLGTTRTKWECN